MELHGDLTNKSGVYWDGLPWRRLIAGLLNYGTVNADHFPNGTCSKKAISMGKYESSVEYGFSDTLRRKLRLCHANHGSFSIDDFL